MIRESNWNLYYLIILCNLRVVEHKDRLVRFGFNYIEKLLELNGRKIEIMNTNTNDRDDLMQDFVSLITSKQNTKKLIKKQNQ